jgi:predicted nuclease of predicted toxin-antitoxin system
MSQASPRLFVALYTDEDVSPDLAPALRRRGYVAQSAAEAGNMEISDEAQLTYATEKGMVLLTHNIQHFIPLTQAWYLAGRAHAGLILSEQFSQRQFGELLRRVLRLLNRWTADEVKNQIVFLQQFRD